MGKEGDGHRKCEIWRDRDGHRTRGERGGGAGDFSVLYDFEFCSPVHRLRLL